MPFLTRCLGKAKFCVYF